MIALDSIVFRELPLICQIIRDETWLESERRGHRVLPDDRVVRDNVCRIVLRMGAKMRESAERANDPFAAVHPFPILPDAA